jgi:DNA-binding NtrC family response regulator
MDNCNIRGAHPVVRAILLVARRIAATEVGALIIGEKGTGKELLARYIHAVSPRMAGPFVRLDCQELAAQPCGRGLSNGLATDVARAGMVARALERARGGTLFVDRLAAFETDLQVWVLSGVLTGAAVADARVLAARDLNGAQGAVAAADLGLVEIPVPALRQRRSDIPVLVQHFLDLYATRHGAAARRIDTEAMVQLWQYDWPGNVRELESVVERVVVLSRGELIRIADLPPHIRPAVGGAAIGAGSATTRHAIGAAALR